MKTLILSALASVALCATALAQPSAYGPRPGYDPSAPAQATPYQRTAAAGSKICRPWCPQDMTPCDPVTFKIADGRCRGSSRY